MRLFLRHVKFFLFIAWMLVGVAAAAQPGSTPLPDSLHTAGVLQAADSLRADSLAKITPPRRDSLQPVMHLSFVSDSFRYRKRLFFSFTNPVRYAISEKRWQGKDAVFYSLVGLLLVFAFIKNNFRRYLSELFSSYFRTTVRQRQVKEQLLQNPLPSLLFNVFFVLSGALFLSLLLRDFVDVGTLSFWMLALYCAVSLAVIYAGKFLLLKFFGWVFQLSDATNTYIFVIFATNKILGIVLLPFIVLLAFSNGAVHAASVTLSLILIAALFAYRYFLSYISVNRLLELNVFHFLLYLAACEVVPLLLINKLLFLVLGEIS